MRHVLVFYVLVAGLIWWPFSAPAQNDELPEANQLETLMPDSLGEQWNSLSFSTRTSESVNWGGQSYINGDGLILQAAVWLYTPKAFKKALKKDKKKRARMQFQNYEVYYRKYAGQHNMRLYLTNNQVVNLISDPVLPKNELIQLFHDLPLVQLDSLGQ